MRDFDFALVFVFIFSLYLLFPRCCFFDIIRGKVLCLTTFFFFYEVVKLLVEQKESEGFGTTPLKGWRDDRRRDRFLSCLLAYHQLEGRHKILLSAS